MRWVLFVVIALVTTAAVVALIGSRLPQSHRATRRATFPVPPESVWAAMTEVEAFPTWRTDVTRVQRLPDGDGRTRWVEEGRSGKLTLAVERAEPPRQLVLRIADPDLPFGGTWTYDVAAVPGGSMLTITENGEIYNLMFRFMARYVFGYEGTIASYLNALEKKLGTIAE